MTILDVVIAGKDEASAAFESVDKSLGKLGSTAGTAVKIGMGVAVAGVAAVGTAAVAAGAAAFNLSSDIQNATNNIAAQMGISKDEAAGFEDVMTGIFANNFGESFDDIGQSIVTVSQALGDMPDAELQGVTEDAFALRDAFDMDVTESVTGAKALMEAFALTGEQSMDLIASGMQNGLNASGDFVESLGEYSNLFSEAGFSAEQMYNIMESGAQAGILGTDKIADAIKEMGIKLNEGTDETKAAFDTIGLSFEDIAGSIAAGDETWADYFDNIVSGLNDIEDPMERSQAQVAIFGTMAEDLGPSFTEGLSAAGVALEDMSGATEALNAQYDNWPSMWQGIKRQTQLALKPLGDALLKIGNDLMPVVQDAFEWLGQRLPPIIDAAARAITTIVGFFQAVRDGKAPVDAIRDVLAGFGIDIGNVEGKASAFSDMLSRVFGPTIERIKTAILTLRSDMEPLMPLFADLGAAVQDAWRLIEPAMKAIGVVAAVVAAAILNLWGNQLAAMFEALPGIIGGVVKVITGILNGLVSLFSGIIKAIKLLIEGDFIGAFEAAKDGVQGWVEGTVAALEGLLDIFIGIFTIIYDTVVNTINDLAGTTIATMSELPGLIEGIGSDIVQGLINGLNNAKDSLVSAITGLAADAVKAAKDFFGISSPSTVFAEIGRNLMEGLASGLFNNMDLPLEAIDRLSDEMDLKMVEKVASAMQALGEAIGPFLEALRVLWTFDFPPLPAWYQKTQDFIDQIGILFARFARFGWESTTGNLNMVRVVSETVVAIAEGLAVIVGGMQLIARANIPGGLGDKFQTIAQETSYLVLLFEGMADTISEEAVPRITGYIEAAHAVYGLIETALTSTKFLSEFDILALTPKPFHMRDQLNRFQWIVEKTMDRFTDLALTFSTRASEQILAYVDAASGAFGLMQLALESAQFLSEFDILALTPKPYHMRDQLDRFQWIIDQTMQRFLDIAGDFQTEASNNITAFIDAARAVFGLVQEALESTTFLSEFDMESLTPEPFHLRDQINNLAWILDETMQAFADIADNLSVSGTEHLQNFTSAIDSVLGLIAPAIEALSGISEYVGVDDLVQKLSDFTDDLEYAIWRLDFSLQEMGDFLDEEILKSSGELAGNISSVLGVVGPAIDALAGISEFVNVEDLRQKLSDFTNDFEYIVWRLDFSLQEISEFLDVDVLKTSAEMAGNIGSILGVVGPAIDALASIGEFVDVEDLTIKLHDFTTQLDEAVTTLKDKFVELAGTTGGEGLQAASNFAASAEAMLRSAVSIFTSLNDLVSADVPEGLQAILAAMLESLKAHVTPAYDVGVEIGGGIMRGIRDGLAAGLADANMVIMSLLNSLGTPVASAGVGVGAPAVAGLGTGNAGMTLNMGGLTFNTTINDQMTEDEFHFRVVESVRRLMP